MPHKHAVYLLGFIAGGVLLGGFCGWYFGEAMLSVAWLGTLFLNLLKMTIIPLIVAAVVSGVASMGKAGNMGRIGGITVLYYLCTTGIAVFIGLVVVNVIRPGEGLNLSGGNVLESIAAKQDTGISDIILSMVSPNLVMSAAETQLLPIILFSIVFAIALNTLGDTGKTVVAFCRFLRRRKRSDDEDRHLDNVLRAGRDIRPYRGQARQGGRRRGVHDGDKGRRLAHAYGA